MPALLVGLIAVLQLALYLSAFAALSPQQTRSRDFSASYVAALLLRNGDAGRLYDQSAELRVRREVEGRASPEPLPFLYPPSAAVAVLPFTAMPVGLADRLWSLGQVGLVALAAWLVARAAPWPQALIPARGRPREARVPAFSTAVTASVLAAVAGTGTAILLLQGQPTGILALSLAAAYVAWTRGHHGRAALAISLGFLAFKPHLAIGLVVFVLALRNRRATLGLVVGALAVMALSLAAAGPAGVTGFLTVPGLSSEISPVQTMLGFRGLTGSQFGPGATTDILAGLLSVVALWACWVAGGEAGRGGSRIELPLATATILSLLLAPHLLVHDLVVLTPVVVWCLAEAARCDLRRARSWWPGPAALGVLGVWFMLGWAARGTHPAAMPRRLVPYLLIAAVLALEVAVAGWRAADHQSGAEPNADPLALAGRVS